MEKGEVIILFETTHHRWKMFPPHHRLFSHHSPWQCTNCDVIVRLLSVRKSDGRMQKARWNSAFVCVYVYVYNSTEEEIRRKLILRKDQRPITYTTKTMRERKRKKGILDGGKKYNSGEIEGKEMMRWKRSIAQEHIREFETEKQQEMGDKVAFDASARGANV
jgi:hypothetical protein